MAESSAIIGTDKINESDGDYLLLIDNGVEGFCIFAQCDTVGEAIQLSGAAYSKPTLVKLVKVEISEKD